MSRVTRLALAAWLAVPAQTPAPPIVVHGWVEDGSWQPATELHGEDFEILVDRQPVRLHSLTRRRGPASIVLLLDATRSTLWTPRPLDAQVGTFTASLGADDRLMLATIGKTVTFSAFRPAVQDIQEDVRRAVEDGAERGSSNTPIWDAIHQAVTLLAAEPPPRAILLLSDGRATGNRYGLVEIADYAMFHGVTVNIVLRQTAQRIRQTQQTAALVQPGAPLEGLAEYTGGVLFFYPQLQDEEARARFTHIAATVRAQHAFAFTPPVRDGQPHRLEIRSKRPGIKVHAPRAFIAR